MSGPMNILTKSINWSDPSKFRIAFSGPGSGPLNVISSEVMTMTCKGIQLAEINSAPIEQYTAEEWRFTTGRLENYQVSLSFSDFDNFKMYKIWAGLIQKNLRKYPDDQKINVDVYTADDFSPGNFSALLRFNDCILTTVSGPALDHSSVASIGEFSVILKCSYVTV